MLCQTVREQNCYDSRCRLEMHYVDPLFLFFSPIQLCKGFEMVAIGNISITQTATKGKDCDIFVWSGDLTKAMPTFK